MIRHMSVLKYLMYLIGVTFIVRVNGQNPVFITEGKIEYERRDNLHAQFKDYESEMWAELDKKTTPQFKTSYFDLFFSPGKTLYKPGRENPENNKIWEQPAEDNVIYNDIEAETTVSQKRIFEQTFLIQDSTRKIKWKITDETRTIAGFQCRRANAIIMDSIYVVAFYTDEIVTPSGPESFSGLPGMILGVALPHQHITWFATKVQVIATKPADLAAPKKGEKTTYVALKKTLNDRMKEWGRYGRWYLQSVIL